MNKKIYNIVLPIWILLIASPFIWIMILPANFLADTLILIVACNIFKIKNVLKVYKKSIIKMFFYGLIADLVGGSILLCASKINPDGLFTNVSVNPFASWVTVVYILICILISAALTYFFNYKLTFRNLKLNYKTKKRLSLFIAVFTAPYLFFYPIGNLYNNQSINKTSNDTKIEINNTYIGNTIITRIFAESENYTNSNFEYNDKINKVSSEIKSEDKSIVTTQISAHFDDSDITQYVKWAKQCSVIVLVKDSDINTININLADENDENKIISNLVYERKNLEEEYSINLEDLQNNQEKLQEVLDKIKQGD